MRKKGFTLIELMVVIAIIAVLAAVVAPQVFRQVEKGRIAAAEAFYNLVKTAAMSYYADTGSWPPTCNQDGIDCNTVTNGFVNGTTGTAGWDGPYFDRWPDLTQNPWGSWYSWWTGTDLSWSSVNTATRFIKINAVPTLSAQKIDQHIDGVIAANSGRVREESPAGSA